jgi:hypothetical protein
VSDESGGYVLPNLPVGPYRLEPTLQGFRSYVQTGIVLTVNATPTVNVVLALGAVSEQISVTANAAMVETRSTGVGQLIDNQRVLELPLNGRQVTDLLLLSPGVTVNTAGGFASSRNYPTVPISVAGGSPGSTVYVMDGASHNDPGTNFNLPVPFPRRAAGIPHRDERASGPLRTPCRRHRERRHQVGHQPAPRQRVRVQSRPPVQRDQRVRGGRSDDRQAAGRRALAQPVRRGNRRSDCE